MEARDERGCSPLHHAAAFDAAQTIGLLLGHGAHVDVRDQDSRTPLHHVAQLVRLRVDQQDGESRDERGWIWLDDGDAEDAAQATRLLLDHGARTDVRDKDGRIPLHYAKAMHRNYRGGIRKDVLKLLRVHSRGFLW